MSKSYIVGFPRIGEQRELKKALESFWSQQSDFSTLENEATVLKKRHWQYQKDAGIEYISCNDFSYYDNMLDTSFLLGAIPKRFQHLKDESCYFAMARGDKENVAMEMTKWFNTNYHYIVPELCIDDIYKLNATKIISEYTEAKNSGIQPKINIIGPLTYLGLSKRVDGGNPYELWGKILVVYEELFAEISKLDNEIVVQVDEPIFVKNISQEVSDLIQPTYNQLCSVSNNIKIAVTTYFEHSCEATELLVQTPIWAIGLDFIHGKKNLHSLDTIKQSGKKLIAGVVDGRNIWKNDLVSSVKLLKTISRDIAQENIIVSSSCSLLHVPFTLRYETTMDKELKSWLSYAQEKLEEINLIAKIFFDEPLDVDNKITIKNNMLDIGSKTISTRINNKDVQSRVTSLTKFQRDGEYQERIKIQKETLGYGDLATTTIGSFPQTPQLRETRQQYKQAQISKEAYEKEICNYIDECIKVQEECNLDVLVHGEPERNDMVEYFAQQLDGFAFSQNGWVQSYGSRCVKPPFIYGDVNRPKTMTLQWIQYAQSKTQKIVKGMLTGPVTILNWSFVRDDIPRGEVSKQIALAINDEVNDLQNGGIKIIQVDEAAFKEGYPLRKENIPEYETWAVRDFKIAVSSAYKQTQIHTHMCYSDFNDIIKTIEAMDADVISIETARSGNKLLKIFKEIGYKQEIGPGIYDIHSPRVPSIKEMEDQIRALLEVLPKEQLWINPDCGLKTRKWDEVIPSLKNMVQAVQNVKNELC
ncbi:5-methyltetrahydropteroyltriglutamate--homocysteine S-methyltransferase [Sulfurimonas sp.]|uniref:5-methyltetrahydropteroyltriglutamate-- homocysteine S-methyltransferase n=1 Tax=Sulfurimonas sp. TaxID=2022749 RepID=UPI003D0F5FBF